MLSFKKLAHFSTISLGKIIVPLDFRQKLLDQTLVTSLLRSIFWSRVLVRPFQMSLKSAKDSTAELFISGQEGKQKQPYFVHFEGQAVMRMAGLFDVWKGPEDVKMHSFTILTTDSSERLQWYLPAHSKSGV